MSKKFWEFKNQTTDEADLYLYLEIASWGGGFYAHSAKSFKGELDALGELKTLNVYINSPGGDVFEGVAIYNMLKRHKAHVNIHVDGLAASIASVITMAGDTIIMPSNAMMMIHNAWMYTAGNSKDLREAADMLDKVDTSIRQSYLTKAGDKLSEEDLITLMEAESWLTAQEAYDYGLCDVVGEVKQVAALANNGLLAKYRNVPAAVIPKEEPAKPENKGLTEEQRAEITRNASLELQNLNSYLGGIFR
ncbi:ATP-dependent Clp protease proteolytic subunit [Paenibacillus allorhizoplanae]|uniref:ATP-dependent Clp protease proteolytic subunit n=1 Tax=Paenibacillus allorhizoplanae TaxID=2905648 RepID=A0ABN8H5L9_9BACL|nr:head maturation protease, ClpP-related [Paenibacillus allorhizoplanae]CAH1230700.1 ATP-dependent Clp protease proteolytic subunit [Paenibacillus allorhizoplanae]